MTTSAVRATSRLIAVYMALSVLTVVALLVLTFVAPSFVNTQAWVRGVIIAVMSVVTFVIARRAAAGSPQALLRLRIIVLVLLVALVLVLFLLPLPLWMVVEQAACGVILAVVAVLLFVRR